MTRDEVLTSHLEQSDIDPASVEITWVEATVVRVLVDDTVRYASVVATRGHEHAGWLRTIRARTSQIIGATTEIGTKGNALESAVIAEVRRINPGISSNAEALRRIIHDAAARLGLREVEVAGGAVVAAGVDIEKITTRDRRPARPERGRG